MTLKITGHSKIRNTVIQIKNDHSLYKNFVIKSTPQIVEIIDSILDITTCTDKSILFHILLKDHIKNVIQSDLVKSDRSLDGTLYREIERILNDHINLKLSS